jgi:hypothetical protein
MNGGAWLSIEGTKVDVLLRDLDVVEHWSSLARRGEFEIDALLGYVAGVPTYSLMAERAVAVVLRGDLPPAEPHPPLLAEVASPRWRFCSKFSLDYAEMHAKQGSVVGTVGQVAKAVLEEAHARVSAERRWVLNEKRLVEAAGLGGAHSWFGDVPRTADGLVRWVGEARVALGTEG